ncbi:MAG: CaiB/BaiF CoA-transferase family protein [SAR324 cluster bacterium]|nr:CaiB/BaiF CoA-transferase family protein [SAR324 cluster bacterium]
MAPNGALPLSRFLVLDLTHARAGPNAVRQLADWGARAIRIEQPSGGDGGIAGSARHGSDFQNLHRNKSAITLNLKAPEGNAVFRRLVERADVVVENFRPAVKHRLGVDYETLRALNPRIVLGSISGFGQDGPYGDRPGFDQIAQGMGGLMSVTGLPGQGPVRAGIPVADLSAGLYLAQGILVALLEREASGEGQWVQSSLLQAMIAMMDFQAARWLIDGEVPPQAGNNHPTSIPTGVFRVADGHINVAASGNHIFKRLCEALGAGQLAEDPRYGDPDSRSANRAPLNAALEEYLSRKPGAEWIELLNEAGVPCGPIYSLDQVFADPQVQHLGMAGAVTSPALGDLQLVNQPVALSRTPGGVRTAAPEKGADTDAVLEEFGYSKDDIAQLRQSGAI